MSSLSRDRVIGITDNNLSQGVRPSWRRRLAFTVALWRERRAMRRDLAMMDARSLRDAGIAPAAAAYESGKPFWQAPGSLR